MKKLLEWLFKRSKSNKCPQCGGELFVWKINRLDCRDCSYKRYG